MKKFMVLCAVVILLGTVLQGAHAERLYGMGITYFGESVSDTFSGTTYTVGTSNIGLNMTSFMGETLGFFTTLNIGFPIGISASAGGVSASVDPDFFSSKYVMSMMTPLGGMITAGPVRLLIGGGLHMSCVALIPANYHDTGFAWVVGGVGASASALVGLGGMFSLYVGGMFAYDFFSLLGEFNELSGIEYGAAAGVLIPL